MTTYINIGAYEAKTHLPEFLRKVKSGAAFRITNRGEHVADLVPPGAAERHGSAKAAERMQTFIKNQPSISNIDTKALAAEGRD